MEILQQRNHFSIISKLSDFQRGRLLGMAEIIEEQNQQHLKEERQKIVN